MDNYPQKGTLRIRFELADAEEIAKEEGIEVSEDLEGYAGLKVSISMESGEYSTADIVGASADDFRKQGPIPGLMNVLADLLTDDEFVEKALDELKNKLSMAKLACMLDGLAEKAGIKNEIEAEDGFDLADMPAEGHA